MALGLSRTSTEGTSGEGRSVYVTLSQAVILPALSAAASARADIVETRRLGWGEGRRDDSTRLAHLASSWDAYQTVGRPFPVWHGTDWTRRCYGPGLLLPLRGIPRTGEWAGVRSDAAISAARAPLPDRAQRRHRLNDLR